MFEATDLKNLKAKQDRALTMNLTVLTKKFITTSTVKTMMKSEN